MSNKTMNNDSMSNGPVGVEGTGGQGGRLKRRLKGVRKRKYTRRFDFECEAVALKMRLIKAEEDGNH
jgi:hypothetical protein